MTMLEANRAVTVYCPECTAPMHLPNRDLLGRNARCWKCGEKVPLTEPIPPSQVEIPPTNVETWEEDCVPEDLWDDSADAPPKQETFPTPNAKPEEEEEADSEQEIQLEQGAAQSMVMTAPRLNRQIAATKQPSAPKAASPKAASPQVTAAKAELPIVAPCGYCKTRVPLVGELLTTDGCPCCGARQNATQLEVLSQQPEWATQHGSLLLQEQVNGPFGTIFHGYHQARNQLVSVRVVPEDCWSPRDSQRILGGLWQVRNLSHKHIVPLQEISVHQDQVYLIGPRLKAVSLADWMSRGQIRPKQVAKLGLALAEGLHAAHTAGVMHRDLKPANVLVTADGTPLLLGFGLPRRKTGGGFLKGPNGFVVGTVGYLAPEQATGDGPLDPRSDVYALGAMLFHLLTGQLPFRGTLNHVLGQIAKKPLPQPSKLQPELSWEWDVLCRRCTAKKPKDRYQTADELRDDLQNIARHLG